MKINPCFETEIPGEVEENPAPIVSPLLVFFPQNPQIKSSVELQA